MATQLEQPEWEPYEEYELDPEDKGDGDRHRRITRTRHVPLLKADEFSLDEKIIEIKKLRRMIAKLKAEVIQLETDFGLDSGEDVPNL